MLAVTGTATETGLPPESWVWRMSGPVTSLGERTWAMVVSLAESPSLSVTVTVTR